MSYAHHYERKPNADMEERGHLLDTDTDFFEAYCSKLIAIQRGGLYESWGNSSHY